MISGGILGMMTVVVSTGTTASVFAEVGRFAFESFEPIRE